MEGYFVGSNENVYFTHFNMKCLFIVSVCVCVCVALPAETLEGHRERFNRQYNA